VKTLPNWHKACIPHCDIQKDAVSEAILVTILRRISADESMLFNEIT
jgi:hypothetical protein